MTWPHTLTWTCHVCDEERPDTAIAVRKRTTLVGPRQIQVGINVRYCHDRVTCSVGADDLVNRYVERLEYELTPAVPIAPHTPTG